MTERELQKAGTDLLKTLGFDVSNLSQGYRPGGKRHATTRQTKGIPDTFATHPLRRVVFWIEWKGPDTKVTEEQRQWHERTQMAGCNVFVVRELKTLFQVLNGYGWDLDG